MENNKCRKHERFSYRSAVELENKIEELGLSMRLAENTDALFTQKEIGGKMVNNRFTIQPMEGCDGTACGAPGERTFKRYERFAKSGAGMIWFEATAICNEGRANPRQLFLTKDNLSDFQRLVDDIKTTGLKENGYEPVIIMQGTHSGRYSKPNGVAEPIIAYNNPLFEKDTPISKDRIITDDELKVLEEKYGVTCDLAQKAGFDGIDVKCSHRYLGSELLSAYNREGEYGGSFENRIRFTVNCVESALAAKKNDNFIIASRLNTYDGFEYPYGFGVKENGGITPDYTEGRKLVEILHKELGLPLVDITIGNPYFNPHVNRPYDIGGYIPEEHPLFGVDRILNAAAEIQKAFPELNVVCSGLTYLRQYAPLVAAAMVEQGLTTFAGFGRESFAYPEFIHDVKNGGMQSNKCCVTCGKCTELMRAGSMAGCVVRNPEYMELYKKAVLKK